MRVQVLAIGFVIGLLVACAGGAPPTPADFFATVTPSLAFGSPTPAFPSPAISLISPTSTPTFLPATVAIAPSATPMPAPVFGVLLYTRAGRGLFAHDLKTGREWPVAPVMQDIDWTKDGTRAVMVVAPATELAGAIWTVNRDGTGLKQLSAGPNDSRPRWSPDGRWIVFERNARYDPVRQTPLMAEIWSMNADGANPRQLANGFDPAWSPDGQRIAYATNPELASDEQGYSRNGIDLMNAAGANKWVLVSTQSPSDKYTPMQWTMAQARLLDDPQWSPDGTEIAFRALGGNSAYLTTDAMKGSVKQFIALFFDSTPWGFSYSPDGSYVTVGSGGQSGVRTLSIYRRDASGHDGYTAGQALATLGHIPKSTAEAALSLDGFAWAPDGSALVYAALTAQGGDFVPDGLYLYSIATGETRQVVQVGSAPVFWLP